MLVICMQSIQNYDLFKKLYVILCDGGIIQLNYKIK